MSSVKLWKSKTEKISRFLLIFAVVIGWTFSSWPQVWQNPKSPAVDSVQSGFLLTGNGNFRVDEKPEFRIHIPVKMALKMAVKKNVAKLFGLFGAQTVNASSPTPRLLKSETVNSANHRKIDVEPIAEFIGGEIKITVPKPARQFRPGKYTLNVEVMVGEEIITKSQDFTWGVLAINTNKSVYRMGDNAYLQMASLDESGHTICDGNLKLEITNPNSQITNLSTSDGSIARNETCGPNNVTDSPDYYSNFQVNDAGIYKTKLTNLDTGYEVTDSFEAKDNVPFEVERIGATRINPFLSNYKMTLRVKANQDFDGEMVEKLPSDFEVVDNGGGKVKNTAQEKEIIWNINVKNGEQTILQYEYKAPTISPQIFLLGPAEFIQGGSAVFTEARQWQIASDNACATNKAAVTWNTGADWNTCSANGPVSGDTVTIAAGHMVTIPAGLAAAATSIVISANNSATQNGLTFAASNSSLALAGVVTMNAATAAPGSLFAVDAGTLTGATTLALPGGTTATWNTIFRISTGAATFSGTITLSGTAAQSQFTFTNNGTLNVGGNFTSGGTLAGSTGTINFNGSGTQTFGAYTTYFNFKVTKSAGTLGIQTANTAVTIGGTLTVTSGTLNIARITLIVTGATNVFGTLDHITSTANVKRYDGLVTIKSTGIWTNTINTANTFRGGITVDAGGSFNNGTGATTFSINTNVLSGIMTFGTVVVTNNVTNNGTVTMTGGTTVLTCTTKWTQGSNSSLIFSGISPTFSTCTGTGAASLDAFTNANTITYSAAGIQTCLVTQYYHLSLTGTSAKTCVPTSPVKGNVTVGGSTAAWTLTGALTINGTLTVSSSGAGGLTTGAVAFQVDTTTSLTGGTMSIPTGAGNKTFTGLVTVNGGTLSGDSAVIILGAGLTNTAGTVSLTGTVTMSTLNGALISTTNIAIANLTMNTATAFTHSGAGGLTVSGTLTVTSPAVLTNTGTVTVTTALSGTGNFTNGSSGALNIGGTSGISTLTATANPNTVLYTVAAGGQTIKGTTYHSLTLSNTSLTDTAGADITVNNGTLTTTSGGTLDMSTFQLLGTATIANNGAITTSNTANPAIPASKNWTGTTGTVTFALAAGGQFIPAGTYKTLTLSNTSGTDTVAGAITATTLTTGSSILDMVTYDLAVTNITNNGTIKTQSVSTTPLSANKTWGGTVDFNAGSGTTQTIVYGTYNTLTATASLARTIKFNASQITNVTSWTVTGSSGQLITLTTDTGATQWTINPTTASVSYVDASNSSNTGASFCATFSQSTSGNNTLWKVSSGASCAAPTVTTSAATSLTSTTAVLNGDITATGGANATVRGFAWGTDLALSGGDTATTSNDTGSFGISSFNTNPSPLTGLICNTTYYSRAYATNPFGDGLGGISVPFTTSACPIYSVSITPAGDITYGFVSLSNSTTTVNNGYTKTATNDGNVAETLNVKSSDATGGTAWTLASTIGTNQFKHEFSTTTGALWTVMPDNATYVTAKPSVAVSGTVAFDFRLTIPSSSTDYQQKSITITVQAVVP